MKVTKQDKEHDYPVLLLTESGTVLLIVQKELKKYIGTIVYDPNLSNVGYFGYWDEQDIVKEYSGTITLSN